MTDVIPPPTEEQRKALALLDDLEGAFEACVHPYATRTDLVDWCNICGAVKTTGQWLKPHWRDVLHGYLIKGKRP